MAQDSSKFNSLRPLIAFVIVFIVFLLLPRVPILGGIVRNMQAGLARVGTDIARAGRQLFASENSLHAQLNQCREVKSLLARDAVEFEKLKDENAELLHLVEYRSTAGMSGISAKVLARSLPEDPMRIVIDQGIRSGVQAGDTVIVGQGIVLGTVKDVKEFSSVVSLLTAEDSRIPAAILGKAKTIGLAEGQNGAVLSMGFIPRDADIVRGDVVVSSGLGGNIPEGLLLGTVTEVIDMKSAPFKETLVEPLADPLDWSFVLILPRVTSAL